jgi:hypothetical protein
MLVIVQTTRHWRGAFLCPGPSGRHWQGDRLFSGWFRAQRACRLTDSATPVSYDQPMHKPTTVHPSSCWNTAAWGGSTDTSPMELSALGDHLRLCQAPHGRFFAMRCGLEHAGRFAAARFVTTLVVLVTVLMGAGWLAR